MSQSWFYLAADEQPVGPLAFDQLQAALLGGTITPETRVRPEDSAEWQQAYQVPGLLPAPPMAAEPLAPPIVRGLPTHPDETLPAVAPQVGLGEGSPLVQGEPPWAPLGDAPPVVQGEAPPVVAAPPVLTEPVTPRFPIVPILGGIALAVTCLIAAQVLWPKPRPQRPVTLAVAAPAEEPREPPVAAESTTPAAAAPAPVATASTSPTPTPEAMVMDDSSAQMDPAMLPPDDSSPSPDMEMARAEEPPKAAPPTKTEQPESLETLLAREKIAAAARRRDPAPFQAAASLPPQGKIDELVLARLKELKIEPAPLCSDAVFVRRAYLDVIGTLPTADDVRGFLKDTSPTKRKALIERLLERDEYADYWAMKWSDLLRIKAEFPINLWPNAAQAYHRWIRTALKQNLPYDQFVRELLVSSGSNFRTPQVNFYRALQNREPPSVAQTVALTFMGTRAEKWPKEHLLGMAGFFTQIGYKGTSEWKEEIVMWDPTRPLPKTAGLVAGKAAFPDGKTIDLPPDRDPRELFAEWLLAPENPWFTTQIVNRGWSWLLGRGIVHEPDDIRPDNPPQNPELLAYLAQELIAAKYDMKRLFRLILNSKTYQSSSIPQGKSPVAGEVTESGVNFASYTMRRLEAEVLIDALCQITGTTESYSSIIPEPFTWVPEDRRTITLPDGSITSSFLELFGRPPRDTGQENERNNKLTAPQRLHLLNSSHIRRKFEQGRKFQDLVRGKGTPETLLEELYLVILSRPPTATEKDVFKTYGGSGNPAGALTDVAWALVNSAEFLYKH